MIGLTPLHGRTPPVPPWHQVFWLTAAALGCSVLCVSGFVAAQQKLDPPKQVKQSILQADGSVDTLERSLKAEQFEGLQQQFQQYKSLISQTTIEVKDYRQSHDKVPRQFKDGEIKIRKQLRRLNDLRSSLPLPLRPDLDAAIDAANNLRSQLIEDLFNVTTSPRAKEKPKKR